MDKELDKLYNDYVIACRAAYKSKADFYKKNPISDELEKKRLEAFKKFDEARNKQK